MASINMESILSKIKKYTASDEGQEKINKLVDKVILGHIKLETKGECATPEEAADKFVEVLKKEINSHAMSQGGLSGRGLGGTAIDALTNIEHGAPIKLDKTHYQIEVWFSGNLHRDSLAPDYFDGIDNIVALLNRGYSARNVVYGTWVGHGYADSFNIPSLQHREGLHFIENAVTDYMSNYSNKYGVIDIRVDDIYIN